MTTRISRYEPASERSDKGQDGGNALRNRDLAWEVRGWDWRL